MKVATDALAMRLSSHYQFEGLLSIKIELLFLLIHIPLFKAKRSGRECSYGAFEQPEHAHLPASQGHTLSFPPQLHFVFS